MRLRRGRLRFFSLEVFRQCLAQAGREAFRGLPRPPKDDREVRRHLLQAGEHQLSSLQDSSESSYDSLVANEARQRWREDLDRFRQTLEGDLRHLYDHLWNGDLSRGWKGRYARERGVSNGEISQRLGTLNERFAEHLGHPDMEPSVETLIRQLRDESPPPCNALKVDYLPTKQRRTT
jgi:hypothetical protein